MQCVYDKLAVKLMIVYCITHTYCCLTRTDKLYELEQDSTGLVQSSNGWTLAACDIEVMRATI